MAAVLAGQMGSLYICPNSRRGSICCNVLVVLFFLVCRVALGIDALTLAHQVMGMMAYQAAVIVFQRPMVVVTTNAEVVMFLFLLIPNVLVVLDETVVGFAHAGAWIDVHSLDRFAHTAFYRKQHLFLHSALIVLILSAWLGSHKGWRYSPRVQYTRAFIDPACLVAVAMILMTHDHAANRHPGVAGIEPFNITAFKIAQQHPCPPGTIPGRAEDGRCDPHPNMAHFPSHPVIGALMCLCAFAMLRSVQTHLAHAPTGAHIDLTSLIPSSIDNGALRVTRLTTAFAFFLLANFLIIDSVMEYLGCREVLLKPTLEGVDLSNRNTVSSLDRMADGLSNSTEMSTYLCMTVVVSACQLGLLVAAYMPDHLGTTIGAMPSTAALADHDEEDALIKPPSEHTSEDSA